MTDYNEPIEENLPVVQDEGLPATGSSLANDWGLDIEQQVFLMEKSVEYGNRLLKARNTLIRMFTYSEDWKTFGSGENAKACLSAAGVLRIVDKANFPIKYHDVKSRKEDIEDENGKVIGYRYVFEGYATMMNRTVFALGQFSTRDKFLGYAGGEWRESIEINESHIRQAAHTYFKGNAAKDLLGLKNIPQAEYEALTNAAGQDTAKTTGVKHKGGSKGGVSDEQRELQDALAELLLDLGSQKMNVVVADDSGDEVVQGIDAVSPELEAYMATHPNEHLEPAMKASIRALTTWKNNKGKVVTGHTDLRKLSGKQAKFLKKKVEILMNEEGISND